MNINRHILLPAASLFALLLGGGCSKSPSPAPDDPQKGAIAFDCTVSPEVAVVADGTKAGATRTLPASCLPAPEQMKLKLKLVDPDKTFEMTYESMMDYDQPLLDPGSYTAGFSYGDPAEEGPDAAYFVGSTTCTIVARKTITQQVSHTLANALYTLHLSDWFKNYYTSYNLTVYTESGYQNGHTLVPDTNPTPIFVRPNTKLYLSGKATKTNGVEVEFPKTEIGVTAARTWHSIEIDAGSAGQASLDLRFDDTPTTVETREIELNPEA
ncbi:DUF4493 domain-containing protein [Alistipes indistinctus]|uniref:DUF4493 domain-containing protein n=1 Tax=Alistipes indistinctus TaxID=626932 RepID=UPI00266EB9DC|nr:DUF4493 domain-containing protein [Alistipes indistinctus]